MKSFQTKLTAIILSIFLISMGILAGLNYWKARSIIVENITNNMTQEVINHAADITSWLKKNQAELSGISVAPAIQGGNKEEIVTFLAVVMKNNNIFEGINYATPDGNYINSFGLTGNISQRNYFQKAIKGENAVSDMIISKETGHMTIMVAVPVKVNGQVTGILYGQISLEKIAQENMKIKVGQTGYAYVVQGDGVILIHPDKDQIMKKLELSDIKLLERMLKGEVGSDIYEFAGIKKFLSFSPVQGTDWFLAINVPTSEVGGVVSVLTTMSLTTIIVLLLLTGLFIYWFARRVSKPIKDLEFISNRIATGDLSEIKISITTKDEIGRLGKSFGQMAKNLRELIQKIQCATEQVAASSQELTASSEQSAQVANQIATSITGVAQGASEQMNAANETTIVVEQIAASIQQIAANANQVAVQSAQATEKARNGDKAVEKAVMQMNQIETTVTTSAQVVSRLGERSKEIGQIIDTISDIAGQTNLLALNAAIEAARAGEQGRGFAVVADEVRKLAEQSQEAAKKIAELIEKIQGETDQAVVAMDNGTREVKTGTEVVYTAGIAFREITDLVTEISGQIKNISAAMQQMAAGSQQIVDSVKKIDTLGKKSTDEAQSVSTAAEEQLASMEEIASSSQTLAKLAENLQNAVTGFRL